MWNGQSVSLTKNQSRNLPERDKMEKFGKIIQEAGYVATIRRSRGQDILGACGQLRTESQKIKQI